MKWWFRDEIFSLYLLERQNVLKRSFFKLKEWYQEVSKCYFIPWAILEMFWTYNWSEHPGNFIYESGRIYKHNQILLNLKNVLVTLQTWIKQYIIGHVEPFLGSASVKLDIKATSHPCSRAELECSVVNWRPHPNFEVSFRNFCNES